jgi:hypothetical protein
VTHRERHGIGPALAGSIVALRALTPGGWAARSAQGHLPADTATATTPPPALQSDLKYRPASEAAIGALVAAVIGRRQHYPVHGKRGFGLQPLFRLVIFGDNR